METENNNKSNVISFNRDISPQQHENIEQSIKAAKEAVAAYSEEVLEFILDQTAASMDQFGINPDSQMIRPQQWAFLEDAIRSLLYRHYGISHPLQQFAEENYEFSEDANDGEKTPEQSGVAEAVEA